jgi:hypothetical protein
LLNERKDNEQSCAGHNATEAFDYCQEIKTLGLLDQVVFGNRGNLLDRCAGGPVVVVCPEGLGIPTSIKMT